MKKYFLLVILAILHGQSYADPFTLESSAFKMNSLIPTQYTCNGADQSPPLSWSNIPTKTQSFALVVEDPNAPGGVWTHWLVFNIPLDVVGFDAGSAMPKGAISAKNSWNTIGYKGPCPPIGMHNYSFKIFALDTVLNVAEGAQKDKILDAMTGHVLGSAELVGLYQKI